MKPRGNKTFMVLTKAECIVASNHLLQNAESFYNDARLLANNNSFGHATSLLIQSTEETMKALILFLDGKGFQFRRSVKGINNFFVNHKLRYGLAMIMSIMYTFSEDLKLLFRIIMRDPYAFEYLNDKRQQMENFVVTYLKRKILIVLNEVEWFSKAEFLRQDGFYVDFMDDIKTPLQISKADYEDVHLRIDGMRSIVIAFIQSFESQDELFIKYVTKLKNQFITENWYENIGNVIDKFKDKRVNPYEEMFLNLTEFLAEITVKKSLDELGVQTKTRLD
jgi:AbiV family abortive infection protein